MNYSTNASWHFYVMIIASILVFIAIIKIILDTSEFAQKRKLILTLAFSIVILGMLFGKYGATWGLPWWLYYPIPMLANVLIPPIALRLTIKRIIVYLLLSFLSAPFIHASFSFFLGWQEYMPFWEIPYWKSL